VVLLSFADVEVHSPTGKEAVWVLCLSCCV
jgi:hypothetical protein